jgi:hypothetical protein
MNKYEVLKKADSVISAIRLHIFALKNESTVSATEEAAMIDKIKQAAVDFDSVCEYAVINADKEVAASLLREEADIITLIKFQKVKFPYDLYLSRMFHKMKYLRRLADVKKTAVGVNKADAFRWLLGDEDEKMKTLSMLKNLIGDKKGRDACLFLVAARKAGKITRPSYTTIKMTFPNIGAQSGYNKYFHVNPDNDDLVYSASEIEPIKNKF